MACAAVITLLVAAVGTTAAGICSNTVTVDNGRAHFWACLERDCVTAHIRYPNIETNPTITLCQQRNNDGSLCYGVTSQNLCKDVPMLARLGMPTPDFTSTLWIPAGFQSHPPKVCFQPPQQACPSAVTSPVTPAPLNNSGPPRLSTSDRDAIERQHNIFRKLTIPSAANMKKMMYDLSLEQFAQNYLDGLDSCPLQHNPENTDYGENVYFQTSYGNTDDTVDYKYIVSLWHEEREYYNYYDNNCNAPPRESCGHYTQVVWDNTEKVGCGLKECVSGRNTHTLVVCNYDPPGNIIPHGSSTTRRPHRAGYRCTQCPSSHSVHDNGLCVKPRKLAMKQLNADMTTLKHDRMHEWDMGVQETEDDTNNGHFAVDVKIEEGGGAFNVQVKEDEGGKQSEDRDPSVIGALLQSLTRKADSLKAE